jgi:hypothetical protein
VRESGRGRHMAKGNKRKEVGGENVMGTTRLTWK